MHRNYLLLFEVTVYIFYSFILGGTEGFQVRWPSLPPIIIKQSPFHLYIHISWPCNMKSELLSPNSYKVQFLMEFTSTNYMLQWMTVKITDHWRLKIRKSINEIFSLKHNRDNISQESSFKHNKMNSTVTCLKRCLILWNVIFSSPSCKKLSLILCINYWQPNDVLVTVLMLHKMVQYCWLSLLGSIMAPSPCLFTDPWKLILNTRNMTILTDKKIYFIMVYCT